MNILVNGKEFSVEFRGKKELTYQEVVRLADCGPVPFMTVVYRTKKDSAGRHRDGILAPGETVEAEEGMKFTVAFTGNA